MNCYILLYVKTQSTTSKCTFSVKCLAMVTHTLSFQCQTLRKYDGRIVNPKATHQCTWAALTWSSVQINSRMQTLQVCLCFLINQALWFKHLMSARHVHNDFSWTLYFFYIYCLSLYHACENINVHVFQQ